jgi:hypothetical protein
MHQNTEKSEVTVIRGPAVDFTKARPRPDARDLTPADGSVAQSENHVNVYCAPCQRWIDCHDDITPEVVLARHCTLFH